MAQRRGQRQGQRKGQARTGNGAAAPTATMERARANGANGAAANGSDAPRGAGAATFTAGAARTAQEERTRSTGRRARARIAQEQAAKRRRLGITLGISTAVVVVIAAIAAFVFSQSNTGAVALNDVNKLNPGNTLAVGTTAPDFDLATVDGKHYKLSALRGHPVLLEFFAVWCPHCQNEAPVLNQIDKAYASKGLQSLSILSSPYDRYHDATGSTNPVTKADMTWFQSTFKVAHPMLVDPDFSTVNKYGVQGYPTIYILDKNGVIRYSNGGLGEVSYQTLAHGIDAALKGQSVK